MSPSINNRRNSFHVSSYNKKESIKTQATTHFLEKEPVMPAYQGGKIKSVKIKPMDKNLFFDGTNMTIKTFIRRYEDAADTDGASERDLAKQIVPFIIGADLKEEVEEMSGYEDRNWEVLKRQMLNRFGSSLALVKYTRLDLKDLIKAQSDNGGIKTLEEFKMFRSKYENITHYLRRMGYVTNLEDFRENLLETLSPELEVTVTRELIRDNKMLVSKDGGDILPDTATLFTYIHREVQTASVMERRKNIKKGISPAKTAQPAPTKPPANPEKAIEEITKTLANWNVQKKPTTFYQSSHVPYAPAQLTRPPETFICQYCHMQGHPTGRCNLANLDEIQGRVKKDGRDFKLPDGSPIPFDRSRSFKAAVDQFHSKASQPGIIKLPPGTDLKKEEKVPEAQTSFGKLEEIEFEDSTNYKSDAAKRTRKGEEKEESEKSGGRNSPYKRVRKEKEEVMDIDDEAERIMEIARKNYIEPEPTTSEDPVKKVQFKENEEIIKSSKEKAPKKTMLERPLTKEFPDTEEKVVNRMLMDGRIELTYGEVFAISHGAIEVFKKRTNPRRIPINSTEDPTKSVNATGANSDSEDEEEESSKNHPTHYACPLGYININVNGKQLKALLDNGSMVNVLSRGLACGMGLIVTEKRMNLKGIGGHKNEIIGIAENVPVQVGSITKPVHFWISSGDVQPILGKPFLVSASATIKFQKEGAESLSIKDKDRTYLVPILIPKNQKWETTFPVNSSSTSSHFLASGTFRK
ncbi:hypothetical protein PCASD_15686 [Puccinia coronata f. sp. avenae]|uniref:Uncharacterized protein n=1 Tax=Puccinia coronata f. sp. avenae TaxID=200324 RepID=A0A2N5UDJ0_9BASI|nr:hypothetical protein PCASD_15686 [Puccinia coronata f. sp. avenae]